MDWAAQEMKSVELGDKRLHNRLISILNKFVNSPESSIPAACGSWSETKAAYCFFDNANVSSEKIMGPHLEASVERINLHNTVLLVQDTTTLNFSGLNGKLNSIVKVKDFSIVE
ncbi:hypothetical protein L3V83_05500 [Thiotrichales bacterium 19X7-9]|nr:hypothetical protein [Thiotrichales bacterium 19X7-9]